jgi:hypothetical protein
MVKPDAFVTHADESKLGQYEWGGKTGRRFFCKTCGVHVYGRGHLPQVGGDYVSVSLNCLDDIDVATVLVQYWDGRHNNWMAGTRDVPWPIGAQA